MELLIPAHQVKLFLVWTGLPESCRKDPCEPNEHLQHANIDEGRPELRESIRNNQFMIFFDPLRGSFQLTLMGISQADTVLKDTSFKLRRMVSCILRLVRYLFHQP